jgi:4-hydroxy 2-oxovalerate aldolase
MTTGCRSCRRQESTGGCCCRSKEGVCDGSFFCNLNISITSTILDGSIRGFGGGAGNTQLEVLVAVLHKMGYETGIDLYKILDAATVAEKEFNPIPPYISPASVISGLSGVVSVFSKQVASAAEEYNVDARDIFIELGKRKAVAGQENLIIEVAIELAAR